MLRVALLFTIMSQILVGCQSWRSANQRRVFVLENSWARMTTKEEFLGFRRMNRMAPIVLDKLVIQANSIDGLVAYERANGSEVWRLDLKNGVEGGAQAVGNRLYFGASDGQFYCVSLTDGKVLWSIPVRAETLAQPSVNGGIVYFQSGADVVYAVDAQTGKQLWLYNRQVTGSLSIRATTRPIIAGEMLLAGFSDGFIVALRKRDGGLLWERKLGKGNRFRDVDSTPVVEGKSIFVSSFDSSLYSLNTDSGEINWTIEDGGYVPVTLGRDLLSDRLFFSTSSGKILSVDKRTGKILNTIAIQRGIATQPSLYKNYLVYGESEGGLIVADALTGQQIGAFEPGLGLVARPTVIEATGDTFFISNSANLYSVRMGYRRLGERIPW